MKKTKILHISKYYPPYVGGIEIFCHDIVLTLSKTNEYDQQVICFNDGRETRTDYYEGIKIIRIGIQIVIASQPVAIHYGQVLRQTIEEFQPDIIHFMFPNPFAAYFLLKMNYQCIFHLDWISDIVKQKFIKIFFKKQTLKLLDKANYVTSISPTYFSNTDYLPTYLGKKDYIACRIGDSRTKVTIEQKQFSKKIRDKFGNKKIVFFYGRHTKYKGLQYLIDSDKFLNRDKIEIIIAGSGELTKTLIKRARKYTNIIFVGKLSDSEINSYLMACDVFAFPSITRNEAFGISLAEALYFGKPACTFTIPGSGVNWVSLDGLTGLEAPNKNVRAFAENITKIAFGNNYNFLSSNAKKRANELFSLNAFDEKVISTYKEILNEKNCN